jgi:tRNA(Ile)-lysidine synthase
MEKRPDEEADIVLRAVSSALSGHERVVLAVSGGLDSMVLLDAAARSGTLSSSSIVVATFDHRTGAHSAKAARAVSKRCESLGLRCVSGLATMTHSKEHEWRDERWKFLRATARHLEAPVVTAHTLDDQIETVFMRILRDAGARGLAGLYADSDVVRPFLELTRAQLEGYAGARRVRFVTDPSNESRLHLRNRIRHELLPAIRKVRPAFPCNLVSIARMAADWREEMDQTLKEIRLDERPDGSVCVARADLAGYDAESLRTLWPAIAARAGVVMDRRGTHRVAEFTMKGHTGGSIQLSGGIEVRMFRDHLRLAKWDASRVEMIRAARLSPVGAQAPRMGFA